MSNSEVSSSSATKPYLSAALKQELIDVFSPPLSDAISSPSSTPVSSKPVNAVVPAFGIPRPLSVDAEVSGAIPDKVVSSSPVAPKLVVKPKHQLLTTMLALNAESLDAADVKTGMPKVEAGPKEEVLATPPRKKKGCPRPECCCRVGPRCCCLLICLGVMFIIIMVVGGFQLFLDSRNARAAAEVTKLDPADENWVNSTPGAPPLQWARAGKALGSGNINKTDQGFEDIRAKLAEFRKFLYKPGGNFTGE